MSMISAPTPLSDRVGHRTMAAAPLCAETASTITVEFIRSPAVAPLEREWRDLEQRSDGSFFTSWSWIGCWLHALGADVDLRLLRAVQDGRTVGLGLLTRRSKRRHGIILSNRLCLNSTGDAHSDAIWVQCNGFLLDRRLSDSLARRMLDHLLTVDRSWDELVMAGPSTVPSWSPQSAPGLRASIDARPDYHVDLTNVRARGDYLELLGSETRAHIRRSGREYQKLGEVTVRVAGTATEATAFLAALKALHQPYWIARGQPGAFASLYFEQFHDRLLHTGFSRGEIQLLGIEVDGKPLGYLYNFVYRGRVYNYQSGFDYNLCENHNRPGLVSHARAIEFNAACGHSAYDFLAGADQYKRALGTRVSSMSWVVLQRRRWRFRLEDAMRAMLNRLRRGIAAPPLEPAAEPTLSSATESSAQAL
jgi:CelD/BcsL family acetyltransferase involved in cellulose biosynthesis